MANGISVDQHTRLRDGSGQIRKLQNIAEIKIEMTALGGAAVIRGSPKAGCSNAGAAAGIAYSSRTSCFET
jgi:hypothetical protein